jgi:hypothetical protein
MGWFAVGPASLTMINLGYGRKLSRSLEAALGSVVELISESGVDKRMQMLLMMSAREQAGSLDTFVMGLRKDVLPADFVAAMLDPEAALRTLRVATWALVLRLPRSRLGRRYPGVIDAAIATLGIENDWELRLVDFEPTAVPEMQEAQFDRYTVEGLIAVATEDDYPHALAETVAWAPRMVSAYIGLTAALDEVDPEPPQPGFSRLSAVEAEIKARQARDSSAE